MEQEESDKARVKRILDLHWKGVNFFTPDVLERGLINWDQAYELSRGNVFARLDGEYRRYMHGVTIFDISTGRNDELSESFYEYQEARDYIKSLQEKTQWTQKNEIG